MARNARFGRFLQGPPSPFARELGAALAARGAFVRRINLCIGDWIFWHDHRAVSYRGSLAEWEPFLEEFLHRNRITDVIYFADRFPYHRVAQRVARRLGVNAVAFEYGYLRPDWIVVEPFGQSGYSHLPDQLEAYRAAATDLPQPDFARRHPHASLRESLGDVVHYLGNYLLWFFYPRFERDRIYNPLVEYLSYPLRFARAARARNGVARIVGRLTDAPDPLFLVPLQMQNDYQIRANSPYTDQRLFLHEVLTSFAGNAPSEARLVVKPHPMDNGLENWERYLDDLTVRLGIAQRVFYLDGGNLDQMAARAAGMITINSTSGMTALRLGCPVKVMGLAVYDMAGLTHQDALDTFWTAPRRPDADGLMDFLKVMAAECHVRGDFYGDDARRAAVASFADRVMAAEPFSGLFLAAPPRLNKARRMGVEVDF